MRLIQHKRKQHAGETVCRSVAAACCVLIVATACARETWPTLSASAWEEMTVSRLDQWLESEEIDAQGDRDDGGRTALMMAARYAGNPEVLRTLLDAGANTGVQDASGMTAWDHVRENEALIDSDPYRLLWAMSRSWPALSEATWEAMTVTRLEDLLSLYDVNSPIDGDADAPTALVIAAGYDTAPEVIGALVNAGADIDARDKRGRTALLVAAEHGTSPEIIRMLVNAGADIDVRDERSVSVLAHIQRNDSLRESGSFRELVRLFDPPPGSRLYSWLGPDGIVDSSPAIGEDGTIYVGSNDGRLYAIHPEGGSKVWAFETGGDVRSSPAIGDDGTIHVGSDDGTLYAIHPEGGSEVWAFETGGAVRSSPAIGEDGTIYVGSNDARLYAIHPEGSSKVWAFETGGDVRSSPAIGDDGTIHVGSDDGTLYAIHPESGSEVWAFETGGEVRSSPAIGADGTVYVGSNDGTLYAVHPESGSEVWAFETGGEVRSSPAIGADGTVYVGSNGDVFIRHDAPPREDKVFHAIEPEAGTELWAFVDFAEIKSSPAVGDDGTVYVGSEHYILVAFDPTDGNMVWNHVPLATNRSSPTVGEDGTVYTGALSAFEAITSESDGLADSPWPQFGQNSRRTGRRE